jgi:hypothetical protein
VTAAVAAGTATAPSEQGALYRYVVSPHCMFCVSVRGAVVSHNHVVQAEAKGKMFCCVL